jgi:hypothetical protein
MDIEHFNAEESTRSAIQNISGELTSLLEESTRFAIPGKPLEEQVKHYSDEESRLLKAHISGALTKYINNLKLKNDDTVPFMYYYMQSVIGVATLIFYFCAAPAICLELKSITLAEFHILLFDPVFRRRWLHKKQITHTYNMFKSKNEANNTSTSIYDTVTLPPARVENTHLTNNANFVDVLKSINGTDINSVSKEHIAMITPLHTEFLERIRKIGEFIHLRTLTQCLDNSNEFIACMEDLRTIYLFYYKGGNSIRTIIETTNKYSPHMQIENLNQLIPYGSDFDTNFLINPFLSLDLFEKIKIIIEIFIPQISQYIVVPKDFKEKLKNPDNDIFTGDSSEQELQMKILRHGFELNSQYLNEKNREKSQTHFNRENERLFYISPQNSIEKGIVRTKISVPMEDKKTGRLTMSSFPNIEYKEGDVIRRHIIRSLKDRCFESLQYSINKTIPKFELYRYFLTFKLGERIIKTNLKHRLIDINGTFNAEMLDISIVSPRYTVDKDENYVSCELVELWLDSFDVFKIAVEDKYKLMSEMKKQLPSFGNGSNNFTMFPVFVNSIDMQLKDLAFAVKDTLIEKKYEKVQKRINRLYALHYIKIISPYYKKDPINDILFAKEIIQLETPIKKEFLTYIEKTDVTDAKLLEHYRAFYEYYIAQTECEFYKTYSEYLKIVYDDGSIHDFTEFLADLIKLYLQTIDISRKTSSDTIVEFHEFLKGHFASAVPLIEFVPDKENSVTISNTSYYIIILDKQFYFKTFTFNFVDVNQVLGFLLRNPENNYRIPSFFLYFFLESYRKHQAVLIENLHPSSRAFIDFALKEESTYQIPKLENFTQTVTQINFEPSDTYDIFAADTVYFKFIIITTLAFISEKVIMRQLNENPASTTFDAAPGLMNSLYQILQTIRYFTPAMLESMQIKVHDTDMTTFLYSLYTKVGQELENILFPAVTGELPTGYPYYLIIQQKEQQNQQQKDDDIYYKKVFVYNYFLSNAFSQSIYTQLSEVKDEFIGPYDIIMYEVSQNKIYRLTTDDHGNVWLPEEIPTFEDLNVFYVLNNELKFINTIPESGFMVGGRSKKGTRKGRRVQRIWKNTFKTRKSKVRRLTYKRKNRKSNRK